MLALVALYVMFKKLFVVLENPTNYDRYHLLNESVQDILLRMHEFDFKYKKLHHSIDMFEDFLNRNAFKLFKNCVKWLL